MKKITVILSNFIALIITFFAAEIFSIYHFGSIPTLLTAYYLLIIFSILEYLLLNFIYIVNKLLKKEKIFGKDVLGRILILISLLLTLFLGVVLEIDWLNWYVYATPFYINVIIKMIKYLVPAALFLIVGIKLIKKCYLRSKDNGN